MKHCKLTALILAAAVCAACSEPERADGGPNPQTTRVTLRREGAADVAVYAFRRQGDRFLFDTLFREGWTSDGRMSVRMPNGQYKFLFASGAADRLVLAPEPLTRQTAWEEVHFARHLLSGRRAVPAIPGFGRRRDPYGRRCGPDRRGNAPARRLPDRSLGQARIP